MAKRVEAVEVSWYRKDGKLTALYVFIDPPSQK
jgi:hypothetical protein